MPGRYLPRAVPVGGIHLRRIGADELLDQYRRQQPVFQPLHEPAPGDNDGVVTVAETRLAGCETGFLLVPALHTPLASRPAMAVAALRFLETGRLAA